MTPGVNYLTLDGINLRHFKSIQSELKAGIYKFPPARRIYIPKPGKDEKRPLTIASPRDKIVQKAIQLVLEQEYEKIFLNSSHGFRPKRGTRTATQYLEAKFQSSYYIIEADFSKAFDTIQHNKLMNILKEGIKCEKTLSLIKSGLKAGYIEFGNLHDNLSMGTPQGSVLSPLLCNIYLHKLDVFVEELKSRFHKGDKRMRNKEYEKLQNKVKY
jgi:group II intron reverse transcriptase/maturase